jgi:hypothetical protein
VYNGSSLSFVNAPANKPAATGNATLDDNNPDNKPPVLFVVPSFITGLPSSSTGVSLP